METRANYILVGSFVLALAAAAAVFVIWLAGVKLSAHPDHYIIRVSGSVAGLEVGSPVRYRGVPVGSVTEITIEPQHIETIRVVIEVDQDTPIKRDTVATLALQGITGVAYVQLIGGTQASPPLTAEPPGTLPEIPHKPSELEQVLEQAPELFAKAVLVADRLAKLMDEDNVAAVHDTLKNLQAVTAVLADRTQRLDSLIVGADGTLADVRQAAKDVSALANRLNTDLAPATGNADEAMKELRRTLRSVGRASDELRKLVAETRTPLRDFSATGLYELSQFVEEARVLVASLTRLTAQIERSPARFFFGDTQRGFEAK